MYVQRKYVAVKIKGKFSNLTHFSRISKAGIINVVSNWGGKI